eukprot:3149648-Rhodomonas_salina.2
MHHKQHLLMMLLKPHNWSGTHLWIARVQFTVSPDMFAGKLPMVCCGASAKYKNKGLLKNETVKPPPSKKRKK